MFDFVTTTYTVLALFLLVIASALAVVNLIVVYDHWLIGRRFWRALSFGLLDVLAFGVSAFTLRRASLDLNDGQLLVVMVALSVITMVVTLVVIWLGRLSLGDSDTDEYISVPFDIRHMDL